MFVVLAVEVVLWLVEAVEHWDLAPELLSLRRGLSVLGAIRVTLGVELTLLLLDRRVVADSLADTVFGRVGASSADGLAVLVGLRETDMERVPVAQAVLVLEACIVRVTVCVPRIVAVATTVPVLVLDALVVAVAVALAVAVLLARIVLEPSGELLDVFEADVEPVVVRLFPGVDVPRSDLDMVGLPLEVRDGRIEPVCEPLAVEDLLLLDDFDDDVDDEPVFEEVTEPVAVFVFGGVTVIAVVAVVVFDCAIVCVGGVEVDAVLDAVIVLVAASEGGTVRVPAAEGVTGHVGPAVFVPVVVRVDVFDIVGDRVGTTPSCLSMRRSD